MSVTVGGVVFEISASGSIYGKFKDGDAPNGGAPNAPTSFTVVFNSLTSLTLDWIDNSDNETGFEIDRSLTGTGGWTNVTTTAANTIVYIDTGLTTDVTYFYRIRAVNGSGNSSYATANGATTEGSDPWWVADNVASVKANSVYADPSVDDGNGAGTIGDPYSLRGAVYNSVLGAEIIMRGGTYTLTNALYTDSDFREGSNGFGVDWTSTDVNNPSGINPRLVTMSAAKPSNEGERIIFRSFPGERAVVDCTGHDQFWMVDNTEYYTLEYFSLINVYIGPQIGRQVQSFHNIVRYTDIDQTREATGGDNIGAIMQYGFRGDHLLIEHNKVTGIGIEANANTSRIYVRGSNHTIVQHNYLTATGRTIYGKHPNDTTAITVTAKIINNFIEGDIDTSLNEWEISNNIVTGHIILNDNGGTGVGGATGTDGNKIFDNTVLGDIRLSRSDNFAQLNDVDNNICFGFDILRFQTAVASTNTSDFNLIEDVINYQESALSLVDWRAVLSQDTNSIAGGPTFVTVPPLVVADFELDVGSLGKGTGRGGADMGAIVANIGAPA